MPRDWNTDVEIKWEKAVAMAEESMMTGTKPKVETGMLVLTTKSAVGIATK